jgi:hypothetical protein
MSYVAEEVGGVDAYKYVDRITSYKESHRYAGLQSPI